jgi:hypothetical protein
MRGWLSLPPVLDGMVLDRGFGQGQCLGGVEEGLHLLEELRGRTKGGTRERERAGCGHGGLVGRTVAGTPYLAQAAPPSLASACRSVAIFPCDGSCRKGAAPIAAEDHGSAGQSGAGVANPGGPGTAPGAGGGKAGAAGSLPSAGSGAAAGGGAGAGASGASNRRGARSTWRIDPGPGAGRCPTQGASSRARRAAR